MIRKILSLPLLTLAIGASACSSPLEEAPVSRHRAPPQPSVDAGPLPETPDATPTVSSRPPLIHDDTELSMRTPAEADGKRREIIRMIWGAAGFPSAKMPAAMERDVGNPIESVAFSNLARVDRLVIDMGQDVKNETFHFVPRKANGRLVVVHQGHGDSLDLANVGNAVAALVGEGYGVLGALMPCYSAFPCPVDTTQPFGPNPHDGLFEQIDPPAEGGNGLRFFVEHVAVSLNYLKTMSQKDDFPTYRDFAMTGLSGGGFTTVLYAAIDPTIRVSIPVSGSKPMHLRRCSPASSTCQFGHEGDREQVFPPFFGSVGYTDLYALGAHGSGRRQIQVQIRNDACCFGEYFYDSNTNGIPGLSWNQAIRAYESKLQAFLGGAGDLGWYRFEIDETSSDEHIISNHVITNVILGELNGDRHPVGAATASGVYVRGHDGMLRSDTAGWPALPSSIVGTPAVASASHIFLRDGSSNLVHLSLVDDEWDFDVWPGRLASDPAAVASAGRLDVVAIRADGLLWHWGFDGKSLTIEPVDARTKVVGTPALAISSTNRLDVFVRRPDGGMQHAESRSLGAWVSERVGTLGFRGFPTAIAMEDGQTRAYARGVDDKIWEMRRRGRDFTASAISAEGAGMLTMDGSPSVAMDLAKHLPFVVARTAGRLVKYAAITCRDACTWAYEPIAGPSTMPDPALAFTLSPSAVPGAVFARSREGSIWRYDTTSQAWSDRPGVVY